MLVNLGLKTTIFSLVLNSLSASVIIQIFRSELQVLLRITGIGVQLIAPIHDEFQVNRFIIATPS